MTVEDAAGGRAPDSAAEDPVYDAVEVLFAARHQLPPDVLRTVACIWVCGSAAQYGAPAERFWEPDPELGDPFADHGPVVVCEAGT